MNRHLGSLGHPREPDLAPGRFYFPQLDGLRGLACLGVFFFHFAAASQSPISPSVAAVAAAGSFGVDLFFILSSFLITSLLLREQASAGRIHVLAFWLRRGLRIWPLYFLVVGIFVVLHRPPGWYVLGLLTFTSNWALAYHSYTSIATHLWSIAVEEQFYFCWPLILAACGRRWLPAVSLAMIGSSVVVRAWLLETRATQDTVWMHTFDRLEPLALGVLIAWLWPRVSGMWRVPAWTGLASVGAAWALVALVIRYWAAAETLLISPPIWTYTLVDGILAIVVCTALVAAPVGLLGHPILVYLGRISFGLYVFHFPVIHGVLNVVDTMSWPIRLSASFGLTLLLAAYSYRFLEQPFLRLKHRFTYVRSAPVP
jgi:peptidoglycan/LPS O-acetylase OafA/YrhL